MVLFVKVSSQKIIYSWKWRYVSGRSVNKQFILLVVLFVTALSILAAESECSSIPEPSVPEFTVTYEDHTYYVPPTYGVDQYTGKNVTIQGDYFADNKSIILRIENQKFTSSVNGTSYYLFYNVRVKGHFGEDWTELYSGDLPDNLLNESTSSHTTLSIPTGRYPYGAQIDVQVKAYIGHYSQVYVPPQGSFWATKPGGYITELAIDGTSGWSGTQTLTLSTPLPTLFLETLIIIVVAASLGVMLYIIKRKSSN